MNDCLKDIMTEWKKVFSISAFFLLIIALLFKSFREWIRKLISKFIFVYFRRGWYWLTNRPFIVSGYIQFDFPRNITKSPKLRDRFEEHLKGNDYSDFQGSLSDGNIKIRLSSMQHIKLILKFETGQQYIDTRPNIGYNIKGGTLLEMELAKIQIHYPEFSKVLNLLRQISDNIKRDFRPLVENQASTAQSVFLEVFYRKDCKVSRTKVPVSLPDNKVSMTKLNNKLEIGTRHIDDLIPYFPKYLVKETLKSVIKKHN